MSYISSIKVLLVEDNLPEARMLEVTLQSAKLREFSLVHVKRLQEALHKLTQDTFDVILLDLTLPDSQGLDSLTPIMTDYPSLPIVVLTNTNDEELALEALRRGAQDYLLKRQVNKELLVRSLCYAIERKQASEGLRKLNQLLELQVHQQNTEILKVKKLNQLKSEFVSMLSHDFRNPLTTILLSTQLLQNHQDKLTQEKKLNHFQQIHSAIRNMVALLDEVLLIGKADSGKLRCQLVSLDLESFCRTLLEELSYSINEKHQCTLNSVGDFGHCLWDESLLRHILGNLLSNALKYSPEGGTIKLELSRQHQRAILKIEDQGVGIPLEDQKYIFEPFNRSRNVSSIPGTGLGLSIVKKCVEVHGGEISFTSQVNRGTTFIVKLPIVEDL